MKNYISSGAVVTVLAPYALASGAGALVGTIFGVAQEAAESGAEVALVRAGVFDLPKATGTAWSVGDKLYWDNTNKRLTKTSTDNTHVGAAMADAVSGAAVGQALITGQLV